MAISYPIVRTSYKLTLLLMLALLAAPRLQAQTEKIAPGLLSAAGKQATQPATYRVLATDAPALQAWLTRALPKAKLQTVPNQPSLWLIDGITPAELSTLAAAPAVQYIDNPGRTAQTEIAGGFVDISINGGRALQQLYPELRGESLRVSVRENPFDSTDIDYKGRIIATPELSAAAPATHATIMTTIIAGAGNSGVDGTGMARSATVSSASFASLLPDPDAQVATTQVQNHSYGVGLENYYGTESQAYDQQCLALPNLLHVFSSGNSGTGTPTTGAYAGLAGTANITGQFKLSKNTLSVGGTDRLAGLLAQSSRGPAHDGRIKPEMVALGEGGNSEAAAIVSGIALLVQETYQEENGELPPAALTKAILINSAYDVGRPGPDHIAGFGNADAVAAIEQTSSGNLITDSITEGETQTFALTIPAGTRLFKATIVWHDVAAAPGAARALVHDLDLTLTNTGSGQTWLPWVLSTAPDSASLAQPATRGPDHLNNVEQITLTDPEPGTYQLAVQGYDIASGNQPFAIAFTILGEPTWAYPIKDNLLQAGGFRFIRWQTQGIAGQCQLAYKLVGDDAWQVLSDSVLLEYGTVGWRVPDTSAQAQLRLVQGGLTILSDTFRIVPEPILRIGYNCAEDVLLEWPPITGATSYQVYQLGPQALEPFGTTTDTLFRFLKTDANRFFAVAPLFGSQPGIATPATDYALQGVSCYIRQFLARQQASEEAILLDLELSTLYELASFTLQKLVGGTFVDVYTYTASQLRWALLDPTPTRGANIYQIRLTTTTGETVYSDQQIVFYAPSDFAQAFPNPVLSGEDVSLVAAPDVIQVAILSSAGTLLRQTEAVGDLKTVSTAGLPSGLYLLQLTSEGGYRQTLRLVVQ